MQTIRSVAVLGAGLDVVYPPEHAALAEEIAAMTDAILNGTDADGNGRVSWGEGEGGLAQAATHLRLMKEAEGLG